MITTPQTPPTTPPTMAPVFVDEAGVVDEEVEVEVEVEAEVEAEVEVEVADEVVGATVGVAIKVLLSAPFLGNIQDADRNQRARLTLKRGNVHEPYTLTDNAFIVLLLIPPGTEHPKNPFVALNVLTKPILPFSQQKYSPSDATNRFQVALAH